MITHACGILACVSLLRLALLLDLLATCSFVLVSTHMVYLLFSLRLLNSRDRFRAMCMASFFCFLYIVVNSFLAVSQARDRLTVPFHTFYLYIPSPNSMYLLHGPNGRGLVILASATALSALLFHNQRGFPFLVVRPPGFAMWLSA